LVAFLNGVVLKGVVSTSKSSWARLEAALLPGFPRAAARCRPEPRCRFDVNPSALLV
jgi:hypothetical protein